MVETEHDEVHAFAERVVSQLEKNGFPDRRVAFPIERLYESAHAKGVNFNKVLDRLLERGIAHEKTPEKVVFFPVETVVERVEDPFAALDPSALAGMSREQRLAAAATAMQQMDPAQLASLRAMVEGLTPEQRDAMTEQARKLGLI